MNIVFAASECVPFSKTGGLADVVGALPKALTELGHTVTVYLPKYKQTRLNNGRVVLPSVTIPFDDQYRFCSVLDGGKHGGVQFYFVDYPPYFDREALYGTSAGDYPDNAERFALYSRAVLEAAKILGVPDIFHCHDWQSALVPILLRTSYADDPVYRNTTTVFTIHNIGYQGIFPADTLPLLMLPWDLFTIDKMEFWGKVNFLKGALTSADHITTVSRRYVQEIQTAEFGFGLENPDASLPVIGIVSRFAAQKGFDLITEIAGQLSWLQVIFTILGSGDKEYEDLFLKLAKQFPAKFAVKIAYDNVLAHKIEAGADMFLMPSRYEPSGLNQMYSLKYGTVPIVRATGGLDDTVEQWDPETGQGTGFKFASYSGPALLNAIQQALHAFSNKAKWKQLMINGMRKDFSWGASAKEYVKVYERLTGAKPSPPGEGAVEFSRA